MSMPISEAEREQLREAMPEVLAALYGITDLMRPFRCPDPKHEDKNPSASYDNHRHIVHCFSCGGTWDSLDLVALHDGIDSFVKQARRVADIIGMTLTGDSSAGSLSPAAKHAPSPRKTAVPGIALPELPNIYSACFDAYSNLYTGKDGGARCFLIARGFDDSDIARHGLGFTTEPKLIMRQFSVWEPDALGFVVIPYFDKGRKSIHYAALRTIEGDAPCRSKEWRPKGVSVSLWQEWLLTEGLPVVYVTEGVFDAIAFEKMAGKPCVALGGTTFVNRLSNILESCEPSVRPAKVMILMDNDEAGRKAANDLATRLDTLGIPHASASGMLGECKDANDLLMSLQGDRWEFAEAKPFPSSDMPLIMTKWV